MPEVPQEPIGLGAAGKKLWQAIHGQFTLDADESALLAEAAAVTDEIIRMRVLLAKSDLVVAGSTGQPTMHPLVAAIQANREQLRRLLGSIRAPALEGAVTGSVISDSARAAAAARWRRAQHGSA